MHGFFSELEKIAEDVAAANPEAAAPLLGVPAAELARVLGQAKSRQAAPNLRTALERAAWLGGTVGSAFNIHEGRPGMAALMSGIAEAPNVISEIESGVRGYQGLKGSGFLNEQALAEVRNKLLSRGVARVLPSAVAVASRGALAKGAPRHLAWSPTMAALLGAPMAAGTLSGPGLTLEDAEAVRQQMGVEAPLYQGHSNAMGKYVAPESQSMLAPGLQESWNAMKLRSGSKRQAREMVEGGGVLVPVGKVRRV